MGDGAVGRAQKSSAGITRQVRLLGFVPVLIVFERGSLRWRRIWIGSARVEFGVQPRKALDGKSRNARGQSCCQTLEYVSSNAGAQDGKGEDVFGAQTPRQWPLLVLIAPRHGRVNLGSCLWGLEKGGRGEQRAGEGSR